MHTTGRVNGILQIKDVLEGTITAKNTVIASNFLV